jgi:Holliday junction resolvasome RuvABC endonuclease subunit
MKVLGLDISSATIGWSLVSYNSTEKRFIVHQYGHIKPMSKKKSNGSFSKRLDSAYSKILGLLEETEPDVVAVEDYAKKFSKGRSSANTIIVLATFNEAIALAVYRKLSQEVVRYPVTSLRSSISKYFSKDIVSKEDVFPFVCEIFKDQFVPILNRNDNTKEECYDEADSIFVALAHLIKEKKQEE